MTDDSQTPQIRTPQPNSEPPESAVQFDSVCDLVEPTIPLDSKAESSEPAIPIDQTAALSASVPQSDLPGTADPAAASQLVSDSAYSSEPTTAASATADAAYPAPQQKQSSYAQPDYPSPTSSSHPAYSQQPTYTQSAHSAYDGQPPYSASQSAYTAASTGAMPPASSQSQYASGAATPPVSPTAAPGRPPYHQPVDHHAQRTAKKDGRGLAFLMGLLGVLVGVGIMFGILHFNVLGVNSDVVGGTTLNIQPPTEDSSLAEAVASKVTPSVVNIDVYSAPTSSIYEDFFGGGRSQGDSLYSESLSVTSLGSGVIISADGYILTNSHVVSGGQQFMVNIGDMEMEAKLVDTNESSDLAVLKVDATSLTPIEIGDSDEVKVGEWVMAVGSPFGLEKSVSTGIVSALYRSTVMESSSGMSIYANMIQTDAAINPGNSGGALVNGEGQLIGINTVIQSTSGSSAGVGFALPSNYAINVANQIMAGKAVEHPYLGVSLGSVTASNARSLGLDVSSGAYIDNVVDGSPAASAGLQAGDVVTAIDSVQITTAEELIIEIRSRTIGDEVELTIQRGGSSENTRVTLGSTQSS